MAQQNKMFSGDYDSLSDGYPPPKEQPAVVSLPGLTEDETRYFQYLLTRSLKEITDDPQKWRDLGILNQKTLSAFK